MQLIIILSIFSLSLIFASDIPVNLKKQLQEEQLQKDIEKEKKYSKEQVFYSYEYYDFSSAEVNQKSLNSIPDLELDDLDMDSVYD